MAIEEEVIEDGEESAADRQARLEQEQADRTAELEREREERHKAEIEAATAKGELEAMKRASVPAAAAAWTDEQWEQEAQKHGTTGAELKRTVGIAGAVSGQHAKAANDAAAEAKREAAEAKDEVRRLKAGQSVSRVEDEFYRQNPALVGRRADVEDFLNLLPAEVKEDPKKYAAALEKAKTYVRGKAREDLSTRRGGSAPAGGKPRAEERPDPAALDDESQGDDVDVSDLDNEGAQALVRRLAKSPGPDNLRVLNQKSLRDVDNSEELLKRTQRADGLGVSIDESDEWARASRGSHKDVRAGEKRPLRD